MSLRFATLTLMTLSCFLFTGCGKLGQLLGKKGDNSVTFELDGSWHRQGKIAADEQLTFSGNHFVFSSDRTVSLANGDASEGLTVSVRTQTSEEGSISYGEDVSGNRSLDILPEQKSLLLTPLNDSTVSLFNTGHRCGRADWAVNTAEDVTGTSCDADLAPLGVTIYTVFHVENGQLKLGNPSSTQDGKTAATRVTELDSTIYVQ